MDTTPRRTSHTVRSARANRRPPSLAVTLTALAIIFALAWVFFVRSGTSTPAPVVNGIQGTYTWRSTDGHDEDGVFGAVAEGGAGGSSKGIASQAGDPADVDSAYDAAQRTETTLARSPSQAERTVGYWPPVWLVATHSPLDYQGLAAIVRTAIEDGDHNVGIKPLKQGDRAVWRAALTMDGKLIDVVVDQDSGVVTWYSDGTDTFTAEVRWASPPPPGTTYTVDVPAGTPVKTVKDGAVVYAGSVRDAARTAGYAPLVSDLAPDGYVRRAVATRPAEFLPAAWTGIDAGSPPLPPPGTAVLQLYTRGIAEFTLEQVGPASLRAWKDLAGQAADATRERLSYQETTLQYGAFKGETALTWYQESGPALFVSGARRAVFVTGALTRQELIAFAEGLKPIVADAKQ